MKVVIVFFAILATSLATKSIGTPVTYITGARSVYPFATHAAQTYSVDTIPTAVHTTVPLQPIPDENPSSQYHSQDNLGQYSYGYTTADGQTKVESKAADGTVSGQYSYFDPEGKKIELTYVADENGFRASGDHLPKAQEASDVPITLDTVQQTGTVARYRSLNTSPQTYRYTAQPYVTPTAYSTYPATTYPAGGYQYAYNTAGYYPGYQRYTYATPSYTGYNQRYSYGTPAYAYQNYATRYPSYQYYTAAGTPSGYQYYTAGRPTGFQYYTNSYPTARQAVYPGSYTYPTGYTGAKSGYSRYSYSY